MSVIDTRTYQVTDTIPLGNFPADVAIDEATHTAYTTSGGQVGVGSSAASSRDSLLGNGIGAGVFVAGAYWFLYLQGTPATSVTGAPTEPEESPTSTPIHDNA